MPLRYNTFMKIVFLASTFAIIYLMRGHRTIRVTYDREHDTFR
jgi:ER lumen protein retaining receptor